MQKAAAPPADQVKFRDPGFLKKGKKETSSSKSSVQGKVGSVGLVLGQPRLEFLTPGDPRS